MGDLVDALGEDHGAKQLLELCDCVDADGAAELAELDAASLELLAEHALPLAPAVARPRGRPRRGPGPARHGERRRPGGQPRRLIPHPRLHAAHQGRRHWRSVERRKSKRKCARFVYLSAAGRSERVSRLIGTACRRGTFICPQFVRN